MGDIEDNVWPISSHAVGECRTFSVEDAREKDLPRIVASLGQEAFFHDRLRSQILGQGALLLAWLADIVVGDIFLRFRPIEAPLRRRFPEGAVLEHLEVLPAYRHQGVCRALLTGAEEHLADIGYKRVVLGVCTVNSRADELGAIYQRLGYCDSGLAIDTVEEVHLPGGGLFQGSDKCKVFVKELVSGK
jgi:predicted N-acetyltransferase YhbS